MKRSTCFVMFFLLLLNGCSIISIPSTSVAQLPAVSPSPIELVDALGRKVVLSKPPSRIVMNGVGLIMTQDAAYMFPEAPHRIVAMGMANQGYGNFVSLLDQDYDQKAIFQIEASVEQMAAVNPDLVILKSYLAGKVGKTIEQLGIPVVYLDFETPDNYSRDLTILGKIFQNETRAKELVNYYSSRVSLIQKTLTNNVEKPRVLLLYFSEKNGTVAFNIPPQTWIQTQMVKMAGGEPVWESVNTGQGWQVVTLEQIAAWDADYILIVSYLKNSAEIVAQLKTNPEWNVLRAVRQGHLDGFPADFYSWDQSDARWILGLSWLSAHLHPALFPSYDILKDAKDFFRFLYHVDDQLFDARIRPVLRGKLN